MTTTLKDFFSDSRGRVVIAQRPNVPIVGWAVLLVASLLIRGPLGAVLRFFSTAFLFTWAYLELTQGDSPFRRTLGGAVLLYLVVTRLLPTV
jgi:hypothetical protein